jgi:hypothetical protein
MDTVVAQRGPAEPSHIHFPECRDRPGIRFHAHAVLCRQPASARRVCAAPVGDLCLERIQHIPGLLGGVLLCDLRRPRRCCDEVAWSSELLPFLMLLPVFFHRQHLRRGLAGILPFLAIAAAQLAWTWADRGAQPDYQDLRFPLSSPWPLTVLRSFWRLLFVWGILASAVLIWIGKPAGRSTWSAHRSAVSSPKRFCPLRESRPSSAERRREENTALWSNIRTPRAIRSALTAGSRQRSTACSTKACRCTNSTCTLARLTWRVRYCRLICL